MFTFQSFLTTCLVVAFCIVAVAFVVLCCSKRSTRTVIAVLFFVGLAFSCCCIFVDKIVISLNEKVESGYVVYLNGEQVSGAGFDISKYDFFVEDSSRTIQLTTKK